MEYTIATSNGAVGGSPDRVEAITCLVGVSPRCFSRTLNLAGLPFVGLSWFWHVGFHLRAHARFPVHRDLIAVFTRAVVALASFGFHVPSICVKRTYGMFRNHA